MKRLEIWANRLFPKYTFDDCLFQIERLGKKKQVHNYMSRYRLGELNEEKENDQVIDSGGSDDEVLREGDLQAFDEMDEMIAEQLSKTTNNFSRNNTAFDDLGVRPLDITSNSQTFNDDFNGLQRSQASQPGTTQPVAKKVDAPQLTDEQKKLMEENRLKALERLKQRKLAALSGNNDSVSSPKVPVFDPQPSTSKEYTKNTGIDLVTLIDIDEDDTDFPPSCLYK